LAFFRLPAQLEPEGRANGAKIVALNRPGGVLAKIQAQMSIAGDAEQREARLRVKALTQHEPRMGAAPQVGLIEARHHLRIRPNEAMGEMSHLLFGIAYGAAGDLERELVLLCH